MFFYYRTRSLQLFHFETADFEERVSELLQELALQSELKILHIARYQTGHRFSIPEDLTRMFVQCRKLETVICGPVWFEDNHLSILM